MRVILIDTFVGFFLIRQLGSTAYSLDLIGKHFEDRPYGLTVFDLDKLSRNANEWASWKEMSPFKADPHWSIRVEVEEKVNDNRKNAIQMVMLHELGHIWSYKFKMDPPGWMDQKK